MKQKKKEKVSKYCAKYLLLLLLLLLKIFLVLNDECINIAFAAVAAAVTVINFNTYLVLIFNLLLLLFCNESLICIFL